MSETWADWFIIKIKEDLREKITTLEEIWGIMIFSPEKQAVAESAARVAEDIVKELEEERTYLRERIDELTIELHRLKLKTPITDNI